jgi:hypothetical protein
VEDSVWYFRIRPGDDVGVERAEFDEAWTRLREAGYRCHDPEPAWEQFSNLRRRYASTLNQMVRWFAIMPAPWIGDRTYVPHQVSSQPRRRAARR